MYSLWAGLRPPSINVMTGFETSQQIFDGISGFESSAAFHLLSVFNSHVTSTNACVLGLLTASAPHFVHLRRKQDAVTSKSISQPAPGIQDGAQSLTSLSLDALPDDAVVQLLQFSLNSQMVTSWAPTCRTVCSHLSNLETWKGQTFWVPSCQCQRLCANCCVLEASLACSFWEAYSPAAHLDFIYIDWDVKTQTHASQVESCL